MIQFLNQYGINSLSVSNMFNKIKKYVIGFFVLCGGILFAFLSGKSAGRKQEKLGNLKDKVKEKDKSIKKTQKRQKNVKKAIESTEKYLKELENKKKTKPKKKSAKKARSRLKNIGKGKK